MNCQRCQGLIVQVQEVGWTHFKCTACGDVFDNQVLENRYVYKALKMLELELDLLRVSPA